MSGLNITGKNREWQRWLAYLSLLFLAILSSANTFPAHFFLDDHLIVELNPLVQHFDLVKIMTSDYWGEGANSGLYRPLTTFSLALNRLLLGSSANAFHLVNLLLHSGIALLSFSLLQRWQISRSVAWLTAALFIVHPIHTEVINMAIGRSELLAALLMLLTLWFASPLRESTPWGLAAILFCYGGALLSKEHSILLLALLPLLDLYLLALPFNSATPEWRDLWRKVWQQRRNLYLLVIIETILWLIWRVFAVDRIVPRAVVEPAINPLHFMEPLPRILTALKMQGLYLWKLLWPNDLRAIYSGTGWLEPVASVTSFSGLAVILSTLFLLLLLLGGVYRRILPAYALLWTLVSFLPTANILLLVGVSFAERLAYFPSLWFCLGLASLLATLPRRRLFVLFSGCVLVSFLIVTVERNRDYASEQILWQKEVERDPHNVLAWLALSNSFTDKVQAERFFREKLSLVPDLAEGQSVYAGALYAMGKDAEAIHYALRAEADLSKNLLTNKFILARAYLRQANFAAALHWLEKSQPMYGSYGIFWEVRGMIFEGLQRDSEAVEAYQRAKPYPADSEVPMRLANLLMRQGRYAESEGLYRQEVTRLDRAEIWNSLGVALALQGKKEEAKEAFARAMALEPSSSKYRENYQRTVERRGE